MADSNFEELGGSIIDAAKCAFGVTAQYIPKAGGVIELTGIFDNQFEQVDPDTEQVVASNQVTLGIKLSDLPVAPVKGDKVVVKGKTYRVHDSQEDGVAGTMLFLHEV